MRTPPRLIRLFLAATVSSVAAYAAPQTGNAVPRLLLPSDGDRLQPQKSRIMGAVAADRRTALS